VERPSSLNLGGIEIWPPVLLAPMAGVTNAAFRRICRSFGGGLFVGEMVGARAVADRDPKTLLLASFAPSEEIRSIQLYGTDPGAVSEAVSYLVGESTADHFDLNFGCPAPKVTRHGGGAALPVRRSLFARIISAAVSAAGDIPVTVKFRKGVDDHHLTYVDTGLIAEQSGASAVALHARTAEQLYSGDADWKAIAKLKAAVESIPVLGNGDIWTAADAIRMMAETGCDGVVVGRGCLGRPWIFADLESTMSGEPVETVPRLGEVSDVMLTHAQFLVEWFSEYQGIRSFRKHPPWYLKGYPVGPELREAFVSVGSIDDLAALSQRLDPDTLPVRDAVLRPRGHTHGPRPVRLPHRYLEGCWDENPSEAELAVSGG